MAWTPMPWTRVAWWIPSAVLIYLVVNAALDGHLPDREDWIGAAFFGGIMALFSVLEHVVVALVRRWPGATRAGSTQDR